MAVEQKVVNFKLWCAGAAAAAVVLIGGSNKRKDQTGSKNGRAIASGELMCMN
jgi:hypothetical protein